MWLEDVAGEVHIHAILSTIVHYDSGPELQNNRMIACKASCRYVPKSTSVESPSQKRVILNKVCMIRHLHFADTIAF